MNFLIIDPLDLMGLGFLLGFIIILITYIIAYHQNKQIPKIKKSLLFFGILVAVIYTPSIPSISKIWVMASLLILASIVNSILDNFFDFISQFYDKDIQPKKIVKISQIIYLCAFLLGIGLIASGSSKIITFSHYFTKQLILLCLGIWLALKLLYSKPDIINSETDHNK
jgi:hypothetical protein